MALFSVLEEKPPDKIDVNNQVDREQKAQQPLFSGQV